MSSDGLQKKAKMGKCWICQRIRSTEKHVKVVGEVRHGFAVGHIWECRDVDECTKVAIERSKDPKRSDCEQIKFSLEQGRATNYIYRN